MGVSLTNCYKKEEEEIVNMNEGEGDKKLMLRSNPKTVAEKVKKGEANNSSNSNVNEYEKALRKSMELGMEVPKLNIGSHKEHRMKGVCHTESSDSSTGFSSNRHGFKKRINENFVLNNSSVCSDKKKLPHAFVREKEENQMNKFLIFEHSHRQVSFLSKSFKNEKNINKELNKELDEYFEKEMIKNKALFPQVEFTVVAIVEKQGNNIEGSSTRLTNNSIESNQSDPNSVKFFVISNIFIYEFEFSTKSEMNQNKQTLNNSLVLKRKVNILSIDFFSITADFKRLIIHINNLLDEGGNIIISNESLIHIVFCICNLLFYCYSTLKNLIVIPKSQIFYEKARKISTFDKMKEFYNSYSESICSKIGELIPYDKNEIFLKLIPLSKIETKFTDSRVDKILIITDKKLIEINSDNVDMAQVTILPLSKMKKIIEYNKTQKFQIIMEDETTFQYSSIHIKLLIRLIKTQHSKECLIELEIQRID